MNAPLHRRRGSCRVCDGSRLHQVLSLGRTPLANAFLRGPAEFASEMTFPLDMYFCEHLLARAAAGRGRSRRALPSLSVRQWHVRHDAAHNQALASVVVDRLGLGADDMVVEVASNDGSLLKHFRSRQLRVLGIEPASNIAQMAHAAGIETVNEFFTEDVARHVRETHGDAAAVVANNVLAHVDDPRGFLRSARALLRPGGAVIVEVPYVGELLDRLEYDTVYHEHLCYFSIHALLALAEAAGLRVVRIDRVPIHGGSLRVWFRAAANCPRSRRRRSSMDRDERSAGLHETAALRALQGPGGGKSATPCVGCSRICRLGQDGRRATARQRREIRSCNYCGIDAVSCRIPSTRARSRWASSRLACTFLSCLYQRSPSGARTTF